MIAMDIVAYFYALSENYGAPEDDHMLLYEQGKLTQEAKAVYQAVLDNGPLDTIALKKAARLNSPENESRFNKALADLQAGFMLAPVAVTKAGAWHYAFAYEIAARHYPEIPEQARFIGELDARHKLVELYFQSVGAAQVRDVVMLFGMKNAEAQATIDYLVNQGKLRQGIEIEGQRGDWIIIDQLFIQGG
jgi:uncharacterized protein YcaQ